MFIVTVIFTSVGALCYATFGDETKIQIISNFPQDSKLVNAVQFVYALAVLVGEPVQLFPAIRILEQGIFGEKATGKKSKAIKWKKNGLRAFMMLLCGLVAIVGASDLDKFVALIGAFVSAHSPPHQQRCTYRYKCCSLRPLGWGSTRLLTLCYRPVSRWSTSILHGSISKVSQKHLLPKLLMWHS